MRRPRLPGIGLATLIALLVLAAAAGAQSAQIDVTPVSGRALPVQFAGQLTVQFHGDPTTGCASHGLCGYSGTVSWRPPPTGQLQIVAYRERGRLRYQVDLTPQNPSNHGGMDGGVTTAAVEYTPPAAPAATSDCLDTATTGGQISFPLRRSDVSFTLADASPSLLQTRCAGPLASDILPAIAAPALTLRRVMRGQTTLALTAAGPFASGGFAGDVQSNVTVRLGPPGPAVPASSGFPFPGRKILYRQVVVTYRASVTGSVVERIRGSADPDVCALLGSCGVQGTVTLLPRVPDATAAMSTTAPASTPYRDELAALGLNGRARANNLKVLGGVNWTGGGRVQSQLSVGPTTCSGSAPLGAGDIALVTFRGRLGAEYTAGYIAGTRCPGPEFTNYPILAAGETAFPLHRKTTLSMTFGSSATDYGYTGRALPHVTLTLTRLRVRTHFLRAVAGTL